MSREHLNKAEKAQLAAVEAELRPWGLAWSLERTKHLMVLIDGPRGGRWRLTIACTPRDEGDAVDHARQKARHILRDINQRLGL